MMITNKLDLLPTRTTPSLLILQLMILTAKHGNQRIIDDLGFLFQSVL